MTDKNDSKAIVLFPHLGLVVIFALFCAIVKICGETNLSWLIVLIAVPCGLYVGWCLIYLLLAYLGYAVAKFISRKK